MLNNGLYLMKEKSEQQPIRFDNEKYRTMKYKVVLVLSNLMNKFQPEILIDNMEQICSEYFESRLDLLDSFEFDFIQFCHTQTHYDKTTELCIERYYRAIEKLKSTTSSYILK
jgi:hypothetical protein